MVAGSASNGSGGGAGLGGGGRSTGADSGGCMASSAGGGWFSMRRDDRGFKALSWKSENATQRVSASVSESFQELVTQKNVLWRNPETNLVWRMFQGICDDTVCKPSYVLPETFGKC